MKNKNSGHNQNKSLMNLNENTNGLIENYHFGTVMDAFPRSEMYVQLFKKVYRDGPYDLVLMDYSSFANYYNEVQTYTFTDTYPVPVAHFRIMVFPMDNYNRKKERGFMNPSNFTPFSSAPPTISYEVELPPGAVVRLDVLSDNFVLGTKRLHNGSDFYEIKTGSFSTYISPVEFDTLRYIILNPGA
ncbi:hypothetical protein COL26_31460 [Bacillus thuringiensis]|uniref:Uncharacterized protein n=1 Tax=Bacillus thuringiensis TaxID=1428 RepID=A0ABD6RYT2_BACTU|nr:hypothetical protein [Bacillus thuringiensis]PER48305.1 hypothetical protein CN495_24240 [Bacillus thuringiensis]PEU74210.1 hypothetical protein CN411_32165 [Bacillus thuringiensis]PFH99666.1 hypothetical protein COI79_32770 [Bacillus thuringiensis]PFW23509.1 hypothetical protein COL26_31460 [Bacillus thuringiensis]PGY80161.1 hypothetical protein COE44_09320 [Bacillus thuringiensis]